MINMESDLSWLKAQVQKQLDFRFGRNSNEQERVMADPVEWSRENITILDENEVTADIDKWLGVTVMLKVPATANQDSVNRLLIQSAITSQSHIIILKEDILKYDNNYLVRTNGREETQKILNTDFYDVGPYKLVVYPWDPLFGATVQHLDHIPPNIEVPTPVKRPRENDFNENLKVTGHGLPPHLCMTNVVTKVFASICKFHKTVIFLQDLSFAVWTWASRQSIPDIWHVAILKGSSLYMWSIWLTVEGCAPTPARPGFAEAIKNVRVKFNLYSSPGGGGGASGSGGGGVGGQDGRSRQANLLGYIVESPSESSSSSGCNQPDSPCEADPFDGPTLRRASTDSICEVPETPLGTGETELIPNSMSY